jgi:hypothetical protein
MSKAVSDGFCSPRARPRSMKGGIVEEPQRGQLADEFLINPGLGGEKLIQTETG